MTRTASKAAPKKATTKATPAKAAPAKVTGPRTSCNFREGGWTEANGFRALVAAPFVCEEPRAKGKNHCAKHEAMYVTAAKKRAAARKDSPATATPRGPRSAVKSPQRTADPMAREIAATKAMKRATSAPPRSSNEPTTTT